MAANLTARRVKLIIGAENWTDWVESWQFSYNPIDPFDSVFKVTGQVVLSLPTLNDTLPSNPDRRFNPQLWARGRNCSFEIAMEYSGLPQQGGIVFSPIWSGNALRILRVPNAPFPEEPGGERKLTLDLGCVLALEDFDEPAADKSGIIAGQEIDRDLVIENILAEIGIPSTLNTIPYPLIFPASKLKGSFVAQVGEIAASAGYGLFCNTNGVVQSFEIFEPVVSAFEITIGQDEEIWRPIGDISENSPSEITVAGIKINATIPTATTTITTEQAERIFVNPDESINPLDLTTIRQTTTTFTPFNGTVSQILETVLEPTRIVDPNTTSGIYNLITSQVRTLVQSFNPDGSLKSETEETQLPRIAVNTAETSNIYGLTDGVEKKTDYIYAQGTITSIRESQLVPRKKVNPPEISNIYDLTPEFIRTTVFSRVSGDIFRKTVTLQEPRIKLNPEVTTNIYDLSTSSVETIVTADGSATPPSTTFRDPDSLLEEMAIKATVVPSASPYIDIARNRKATIDLDYVTSVTQLEEFGRNYLRILYGRNYSWQLQCPIFNELLDSVPLKPIRIIDNGVIWFGYLDAMEISGNLTESFLSAVFIENGQVTPSWSV